MLTKVCPICNKEFNVKNNEYGIRVYCSRECMSSGYKLRMGGENNPNYRNANYRVCEHCGKEYRSYKKNSRFCSMSCAGSVNIKNIPIGSTRPKKEKIKKPVSVRTKKEKVKHVRVPVPPNLCKECGARLLDKPTQVCRSCFIKGSVKANAQECVVCHNSFFHKVIKKTCSRDCLRIWRTISQKGEKSHRWQGGKTPKAQAERRLPGYRLWRDNVYKRDDYTCQICLNRGGKLAAHHIKRFALHPELALTLGNGITLCWKCHTNIRHKESLWEDLFLEVTGGITSNSK